MKWREERYEMLPYFETKIQTGFNYTDRKTLVDWMVEFQEIQETTHGQFFLMQLVFQGNILKKYYLC